MERSTLHSSRRELRFLSSLKVASRCLLLEKPTGPEELRFFDFSHLSFWYSCRYALSWKFSVAVLIFHLKTQESLARSDNLTPRSWAQTLSFGLSMTSASQLLKVQFMTPIESMSCKSVLALSRVSTKTLDSSALGRKRGQWQRAFFLQNPQCSNGVETVFGIQKTQNHQCPRASTLNGNETLQHKSEVLWFETSTNHISVHDFSRSLVSKSDFLDCWSRLETD